jgi:hypothetical protein
MNNATIRFLFDDTGSLTALELRSRPQTDLMLELARTLYRARVDVLSVQSRRSGSDVTQRVQLDGSTLPDARRAALQADVLELVHGVLSRSKAHTPHREAVSAHKIGLAPSA